MRYTSLILYSCSAMFFVDRLQKNWNWFALHITFVAQVVQ